MKTFRNTLLGLLVTLILITLPSTALAHGSGNYSGDDTYDPAVNTNVKSRGQAVMNFSGDDDYDLVADGLPEETPMRIENRFSDDGAYDPAACGLHHHESTVGYAISFSGDDDYDLAVDGLPEETPVPIVNRFSGDDAYDPAAGGLHPYETTTNQFSSVTP